VMIQKQDSIRGVEPFERLRQRLGIRIGKLHSPRFPHVLDLELETCQKKTLELAKFQDKTAIEHKGDEHQEYSRIKRRLSIFGFTKFRRDLAHLP
jgi:hypothetical protein